MSEEEKSQVDHIEDIISRKLRPFYWIMITFVAIYSGSQYFTISNQANFTLQQNGIIKDIESKASKDDVTKAVEIRERDYLKKLDYYKMEVDEHDKMKECFTDHSRAEYVLKGIEEHLRFELNLNLTTYRGGGQAK